jgi:hypothetical protein
MDQDALEYELRALLRKYWTDKEPGELVIEIDSRMYREDVTLSIETEVEFF